MQTQIKQWGNSLALRIPKSLADQLAIKRNTDVELLLVSGQLIVKPLPDPEITLSDLLADITEENLHGEIEAGAAVGKEVW